MAKWSSDYVLHCANLVVRRCVARTYFEDLRRGEQVEHEPADTLLRRYLVFCGALAVSPMPANGLTVCVFTTCLRDTNYLDELQDHLDIIATWHRDLGYKDPTPAARAMLECGASVGMRVSFYDVSRNHKASRKDSPPAETRDDAVPELKELCEEGPSDEG